MTGRNQLRPQVHKHKVAKLALRVYVQGYSGIGRLVHDKPGGSPRPRRILWGRRTGWGLQRTALLATTYSPLLSWCPAHLTCQRSILCLRACCSGQLLKSLQSHSPLVEPALCYQNFDAYFWVKLQVIRCIHSHLKAQDIVPTLIQLTFTLCITEDLLEALVKSLFALLQLLCQGFPCIEHGCTQPPAPFSASLSFAIMLWQNLC